MGMELKQGSGASGVPDAAFVDDKSLNNSLHMQGNSRVLSTWLGVITATSPGTLTGLGGDTTPSLPSGAVPVGVKFFSPAPGSTGGTLTLSMDTTTGYFLNGVNVAATVNVLQQSPVGAGNLFVQTALLPPGSAHPLTGFFAQSATSTAAGPFYIQIDYYRPIPA